jgi:hypothetical protein
MFRSGPRQIDTEFGCRFEFFRMERKAENTIDAGLGESKFLLGGHGECNDGHFARKPHFADLVDGFNNPLRAKVEPRRRQHVIRRENHEIKFFATGLVREFVNANGPGALDAGAVVTEVEDHDFDQIADTAIRIANQKVERFHQFEKKAAAWWNGRNACVPARGKARALPKRKPRKREGVTQFPSENCPEVYRTETGGGRKADLPISGDSR